MESQSLKPKLPEGWIVRCSKTYKGKIYYWNERTGDSAWYLQDIVDFPVPPVKKPSSISSEGSSQSRMGSTGKPKCFEEPKVKIEPGSDSDSKDQIQMKRKWKSEEGSTSTSFSAAKKVSLKRPKFNSTLASTYSPASTDSGHSTLGSDTSLTKRMVPPATSSSVKHTITKPQAGFVQFDDSEAMEVDEVDDEEMMIDIQGIREKLKEIPHSVFGELTKLTSQRSSSCRSTLSNIIYIVLDTNVLLSDLKLIQTLPLEFQGLPCELKFMVPWVVLQELDAFKNENYYKNKKPSLCRRAQMAIKFVHSQLSSISESSFQGQTLNEVFSEKDSKVSNDDRILQYCLSCAKKSCVILFTNDINLRSKAIVNFVASNGREDITKGISLLVSKLPLPTSTSRRLQMTHQIARELNTGEKGKSELRNCLYEALSLILDVETRKEFGDLWDRMIFIKPPWDLDDVLRCFDKHWIAVFGYFLRSRECSRQDLLELKEFFLKKSGHLVTLKELLKIIDTAIRFLGEFRLRSDYGGGVSKVIERLTKLYNRCDDEIASGVLSEGHSSHHSEPAIANWDDSRPCRTSTQNSTPSQSTCNPLPYQSTTHTPTHIAHTPPLNRSMGHVSKPVPASELPPPELCLPAPVVNERILTENIEHQIHSRMKIIWSNIERFLGMLCDRFGVPHTLEYEKPEELPPMDECLNFLPRLYPVVCRLTKDLRGVLEVASDDGKFPSNCCSLRDSLMNFHENLDIQQDDRTFEEISVDAFCNYCALEARREEMSSDLWKLAGLRTTMEELEKVTRPQGVVV